MITWPDLTFPPINLYSAPFYQRGCLGICDKTGTYCRYCYRKNEKEKNDKNQLISKNVNSNSTTFEEFLT